MAWDEIIGKTGGKVSSVLKYTVSIIKEKR
jgi:hypothetical protein